MPHEGKLSALIWCKLRHGSVYEQAFNNTVKRMIEAAGRGMWNADETTLNRLKELYSEMQDELEGV